MDHAPARDVSIEPGIDWDGSVLTVVVRTLRGPVRCEIPRDTVHAVPTFSDALTREIARDREEIVERLRHAIARRAALAATDLVRVEPGDL